MKTLSLLVTALKQMWCWSPNPPDEKLSSSRPKTLSSPAHIPLLIRSASTQMNQRPRGSDLLDLKPAIQICSLSFQICVLLYQIYCFLLRSMLDLAISLQICHLQSWI